MIVTIIGARPQFVKAAVLSAELNRLGLQEYIIHTGQHYDHKMSAIFFEELNLPGANINLGIGSGTHGSQTAEMLSKIESVLMEMISQVKCVLLYGDTNSTLAGALAASKLNIPIIHVESGLRSFNRKMPEEVNRVITDHLSSLLFCSSNSGKQQLENEGINTGVYVTGDLMLDAFSVYGKIAETKMNIANILPKEIVDNYVLLTIHRPSNTDDINNIIAILNALTEFKLEIVWPVHPRIRKKLLEIKLPDNVHLYEPFSYFEMMAILLKSQRVITDSGGLQKEAYWAKKACITIREETEWIETLHDNWNILTGCDSEKIKDALRVCVKMDDWTALYGDGNCASSIAARIKSVYF